MSVCAAQERAGVAVWEKQLSGYDNDTAKRKREGEKERVRHVHITYYLAELMRKQMNPKDHITNSNEILQYKAQLYIQHAHILSLR